MYSPHVQKVVMGIAITMHNILEDWIVSIEMDHILGSLWTHLQPRNHCAVL